MSTWSFRDAWNHLLCNDDQLCGEANPLLDRCRAWSAPFCSMPERVQGGAAGGRADFGGVASRYC